MKIATFNVKSVVRRLPNLVAWLKSAKPDVVCLQELKADETMPPREALEKVGYRGVWRGQKTCNGVLVGCLYLPNGNPQPRPKFDYKLAWFERLIKHARALKKSGAPVVLAGDFNVVPTDAEIYPTKSWDDDARLQLESRAAYNRLLRQGWADGLRAIHPHAPMYAFWDYKRLRWPRDAGLRIDHLLLSPDLAARLVEAGVDRHVPGIEGASDHAPAWIVLKDLR